MELPKDILTPDPPAQPTVDSPRLELTTVVPSRIDPPKTDLPKIDPPKIVPPEIAQPKMEHPNVDQPKAPQTKPESPTSAQTPQVAPAMLASPTTQNAIKLAGEAIMPGASLLMDGKIVHGGAHLLAGAVAKAFLGPVGIAFVIANSYSNSTTGKNLLEQLQRFMPPKPE